MGYTDYIQTKLDELSNGVDQSIVRDDLFLNNWQNDKLVRPVDLYNNKGVKLYSISLNDQSVVPNIILGERQDKTARPAIRPSNWLSMTYVNDKGKLIEGKFPIFYPYIKINDDLGRTPANYHVYSLIGYKQAADPETRRLNYIPIYGLVSKKGYKYRGHTVVEYGKESQFDFNKESVWDYTEALQNQEALADMSDEYSKPNWQNSDIHLITDLPPYQNMNYAKEQQDMKFEWDQDDKDDNEQGVVLSEAEESKEDSKNLLQLEADLLYKMKEYLTELSKDNTDLASSIDDKMEEFTQLLRKENPTTPEEVEGLINKFICNL